MSIPFRQYLRPNGRIRDEHVDRPSEIEALAQTFIARGGRFECEVLSTWMVSLTACLTVDGELTDIAIRLCANGPEVLDATDSLVREAAEWSTSDGV